MSARTVAVDADTMESVAHEYGLTIEFTPTHAYLVLDGTTFVADLEPVAS